MTTNALHLTDEQAAFIGSDAWIREYDPSYTIVCIITDILLDRAILKAEVERLDALLQAERIASHAKLAEVWKLVGKQDPTP
jgi:hypothetical protein